MLNALLWKGPHRLWPDVYDRAATTAAFDAWSAQVVRSQPRERVLAFSVKQGWGPLCAFLGTAVPDSDFPNVNEAKGFQMMIAKTRRMDELGKRYVAPVLLAVVGACVGYGVAKLLQRR